VVTSATFKDGTKEAVEKIKQLRDIALTEGAIIMEGNISIRCPVDTGHLRQSIGRKVYLYTGAVSGEKKNDGLESAPTKEGEAYVGTNVEYAPHVEYGTKYQKAQPYMRPGAIASERQILSVFQRRLGENVTVTRVEEKKYGV
jgi:HK97 gp10 family phage protein